MGHSKAWLTPFGKGAGAEYQGLVVILALEVQSSPASWHLEGFRVGPAVPKGAMPCRSGSLYAC